MKKPRRERVNDFDVQIADLVRAARTKAGRTQAELAHALGVAPPAACLLERGRAVWKTEYTARAAAFLAVPLEQIIPAFHEIRLPQAG